MFFLGRYPVTGSFCVQETCWLQHFGLQCVVKPCSVSTNSEARANMWSVCLFFCYVKMLIQSVMMAFFKVLSYYNIGAFLS